MHIKQLRFSKSAEREFAQALKRRVNLYFTMNKVSKRSNTGMVLKSAIMLIAYFAPLILLFTGIISSPILVLALYFLSGLGLAGIGMGIMHDANHGSYSRIGWVNYLFAHTLDIVGNSSAIWKLQHNVLHHTYTNIHDHDEDIESVAFFLRFSPNTKRYGIQRFQHIYVWFFYGLLTLNWFLTKDFVKLFDYRKKGLITTRKELWWRFVKLLPIKLGYITYSLFIPMWMTPLPFYWVLIGFIVMHFTASLLLSVVFQLAHVVPEMAFPLAENVQEKEVNWYVHQLQTTSNFSPNNRFLAWYFGGLTNQIEHHLFPNICHVHYRKLSKIVQQTAKEYHIPYHVNRTFFSAVAGHVKTLKSLGKSQKALK